MRTLIFYRKSHFIGKQFVPLGQEKITESLFHDAIEVATVELEPTNFHLRQSVSTSQNVITF